MLKFVINLTLGDWSNDGHGRTGTVTIKSNLSSADIRSAYDAGVKKTGVDFSEDVAIGYEDNILSAEDAQKLVACGINVEAMAEPGVDGEFTLWTDTYSALWLAIVKVGDPSFEYDVIENEDVRIGGYGLYGS